MTVDQSSRTKRVTDVVAESVNDTGKLIKIDRWLPHVNAGDIASVYISKNLNQPIGVDFDKEVYALLDKKNRVTLYDTIDSVVAALDSRTKPNIVGTLVEQTDVFFAAIFGLLILAALMYFLVNEFSQGKPFLVPDVLSAGFTAILGFILGKAKS